MIMQRCLAILLALAAAAPARAAKLYVSTTKHNIAQWQASEVLNGQTYTLPAKYTKRTMYGAVNALEFPFSEERKIGRNDGFWYADLFFTLPGGATNPKLHLTSLIVDDRAVVELNGTIVSDGGIDGPGKGNMTFTDGGPNKPYQFKHGDGAQTVHTGKGFVAGTNDLRLIVNNTGQGIHGEPIVKIKGNPTYIGIVGRVTYQTQNGTTHTADLLLRPLR
jgi:hypothetical protein